MICFREIDQPEVLMTNAKIVSASDLPQIGVGNLEANINLGGNTLDVFIAGLLLTPSGFSVSPITTIADLVYSINDYINANSNLTGFTSAVVLTEEDVYTFQFTVNSCDLEFTAGVPLIGFVLVFETPYAEFDYTESTPTNTSTCATYLTNCQNVKANLQVYNCCAAKKADEYIKLKKKGIDCSDKLEEITFLMGGIQALKGYDINNENNCITVEEVEEIMYKMSKICNDCSCKDYVNFQ